MTDPARTATDTAAGAARTSGAPTFQTTDAPLTDADRTRLDRALAALDANRRTWAHATPQEHLEVIQELIDSVDRHAAAWVGIAARIKGVQDDPHGRGQEWGGGPYVIMRHLTLLRASLRDIARAGAPRPSSVRVRDDGRTVVRAFPADVYDHLVWPGATVDVIMQPDVTPGNLAGTQAPAYREPPGEGRVRLVLGAGNVTGIGPGDALDALFEHREVVILKLNPVLEDLQAVLEQALAPLIERGVLRIVRGGARAGEYLVTHPTVHAVHITGSDKTYDAIVFGGGEEGARRKADGAPRLSKPVTAELGGISPTIVVPGPWSAADIAYHGHGLATALANNAGCNCATTRVIIQHTSWPQRTALLAATREVLQHVTPRTAFYPGAHDRWENFTAAHPDAHRIGTHDEHQLPWTLIEDADPDTDDAVFRSEPFCSLMASTALDAADTVEFIRRAVDFANERVWGTLNATLLVHPASLRNPAVARAVEQAVRDLRYGIVAVNLWSGFGWPLIGAPWGAHPGNEPHDIGSGVGFTHNTLMFSWIEKTVVRAPFRSVPTPPGFALFRTYDGAVRALTRLLARPGVSRAAALIPPLLRGHHRVR